MKNGYTSPDTQFDVKILAHNELNSIKNSDYFMLYSMIKFGRLLEGKEIRIKYQPEKIHQEYIKQMDTLDRLTEDTKEKKDCQLLSTLIFGTGKTLRFIEKVMTGECKNLKEIFGRNLVLLGKEYEQVMKKQGFIKLSLSQKIKIKGKWKQKCNYERLNEAINQVREYGKGIEKLLDTFD